MTVFVILTLIGSSSPLPAKKKSSEPKAVALHELLNKFQTMWDATKSYQTRFKQVTYAKTVGTRDELMGTLYVKKPDKLRWESDDGNVEIVNGKKLTSLQKNRRTQAVTVDIFNDISKRMDTKALYFLAGATKLRDLYDCSLGDENKNIVEVNLKPKDKSPESYVATINKTSYLLSSLTTESVDTRTVLEFVEIKTGVVLPDTLFDYRRSGKDIVHINP